MAPKKKKTKPPVNPARGFATTSIASKSKQTSEGTSANESSTETPNHIDSPAPPVDINPNESQIDENSAHVKEFHELSPEELEQRLEDADCQRIVEKFARQIQRDSSRCVDGFETDYRLKRTQAQGLQCPHILPERQLSILLQLAHEDLESGRRCLDNDATSRPQSQGDNLVTSLWALQTTLESLGFSPAQIDSSLKHILRYPPPHTETLWGLEESLEWLTITVSEEFLPVYDHTGKAIDLSASKEEQDDEDLDDSLNVQQPPSKADRSSGVEHYNSGVSPPPPEEDFEVSELEDGLELEELQSIYLATKGKLYEQRPALFETRPAKNKARNKPSAAGSDVLSPGIKKLQQKLQRIEADVLFDKHTADLQWENQRIITAREQAERRKLQVVSHADSLTSVVDVARPPAAPKLGAERLQVVVDPGNSEPEQSDDDDQAFADLFNAEPACERADGHGATPVVNSVSHVSIRDFGQPKGVDPRRVLEDACRSRDPSTKISYKLISTTAFSNRHKMIIDWSKAQGCHGLDHGDIETTMRPMRYRFTMIHIATPDASQSVSLISVFALFQLSMASGRDDKAYLRLPTAWKDFYGELQEAYRRQTEDSQKDIVRQLKHMIDENPNVERDDDVVLTRNFKNRQTNSNGAPQDQAKTINGLGSASGLQELWQSKSSSHSYQQMLRSRKNLPMWSFKEEVLRTIEHKQVTIIRGETGCGKSTQTPSFILERELSQGRNSKIYCTEPRRISAITLAQRVSQELGEHKRDLGTPRSLVGYSIRLESQVSISTRLIYATTGIVLRMLESKDGFEDVTHIIVDEVHERSIETDFLLILLRSLRYNRPELKIVLMSATVDADKFSKYFDGAPVLNVPGRTFPVTRKFLEDAIELTGIAGGEDEQEQDDGSDGHSESDGKSSAGNREKYLAQYSSATRSALTKWNEYRINYGLISKIITTITIHPSYLQFNQAILVFLPGIAEIRAMHSIISGSKMAERYQIHMLHSTIGSDEQQAAFTLPPAGFGKIVLSTNIAETGVTIPDVTCVIDTGTHKEMRFDERRQISRLIESFISRANAKQRCGRAGRVQEGLCFHLFTKQRHDEKMTEAQTPEMLRLSLQDLVMRVKICRLGNIESTLQSALDPPSVKNINRAITALKDVNALSPAEDLTPLGRQLSKLPLDPYLGKLVLHGAIFSCLDVALTLAALLSSKSPFVAPAAARSQADAARAAFKTSDSDLLTEFAAYAAWRRVCTENRGETQFCRRNCLSSQTLCNIEDIKAQLLTTLTDDIRIVTLSPQDRADLARVSNSGPHRRRRFVPIPAQYNTHSQNFELVSAVIAWSFHPKLLVRHGRGWKNAGTDRDVHLHPSSVLRQSPPANFERVKLLSFYSIMQGGARNLNATGVTPVTPLLLILGAGATSWYATAGVVGVDGKLRFLVDTPSPKRRVRAGNAGEGKEGKGEGTGTIGPWKTFAGLKILRRRLDEIVARKWRKPAEPLPRSLRRWYDAWMEMVAEMGKAGGMGEMGKERP